MGTTIVLDDNACGTHAALMDVPEPKVYVEVRDGNVKLLASYTDLDALTEATVVFIEALEKLNAAVIAKYGVRCTAADIMVGDLIVRDERVIAINSIEPTSKNTDAPRRVTWFDPLAGAPATQLLGPAAELIRIDFPPVPVPDGFTGEYAGTRG